MTERPITLVLDASAVAAYTRSSIDVGEVLVQVDEEKAVAAIPLPCLVEAAHTSLDRDRLDVLISHPTTMIISENPRSWQALVQAYSLIDRYEAAVAALLALDHDAVVLSRRPDRYAAMNAGGLVIPFEE